MDRKMFVPINLLSLLLLLLIFVFVPVRCYLTEIEKISRGLDEFLGGAVSRENFDEFTEKDVEFWQRYEFGTGVGNRDELSITNITIKIDPGLSNFTKNYQFIERGDDFFLAGSNDHALHLYRLDLVQGRTIYRTEVNFTQKILNFKLFGVPNTLENNSNVFSNIIVIICVESQRGTDMLWYRFAGDKLVYFESLPVQERVESLQFFHHEGQNILLILREETSEYEKISSPIDIYGFSITGKRPNLWLLQRLNVPKTFNIHVCPNYDSTIIALRRKNYVEIYDYRSDQNDLGHFIKHQNLTSNNLKNLICFESGYIRYLVTSGPEAALFDFFETEFQHDSYTEHIFNEIGEISWIQSVPVDNYKQESILLVQLKNSSTIALSWKGRGFEKISLPNLVLNNFDLSRVTVIPKYGFVSGNKFVKIDTSLNEKHRPVRDELEKLLRTRYALAEVLRKQELVLDETETRINKSYFVNPVVTGFWNLSKIEVQNLTIGEGVSYDEFTLGSKQMSLDDFFSDQNETEDVLNDLESKIHEIKVNLANSIPRDSPVVVLSGDLFVDGNFDVRGTMHVNNLTFDSLNGFSRDELTREFYNYDENLPIEGEKTFELIDAKNLSVMFINGVPVEEFQFDIVRRDYTNVDFSKLTKLRVDGNLNFTTVNDVNWEDLMKKVVFKSQSASIPGITVVEGDLVADKIQIENLNGLLYPDDYIMAKNRYPVVMTGEKKFDKLTVERLDFEEIETINGVSINEYVTLYDDRTLTEEITFHNLTITKKIQIDGTVTGLSDAQKMAGLMLNETSNVTADVFFENLRVMGDFEVENSLNGTTWSELDDLVSIDDSLVEITGRKKFMSHVEVDSELVIDKRVINGHSIDEFVTLDTDQEFPNLEKISGNVTFGHVTREDLESLKKLLTQYQENFDESKCLEKFLIFKVPPIVDQFFFQALNNNISASQFMESVNRTFGNVRFQNLEVTNLRCRDVLPITVNNENFENLKRTRISKTESQVLTGCYEIDRLETNLLTVRAIDGLSTTEMENLRIGLNDFYDGITNGSVTIENLTVEGRVSATSINEKSLKNLYDPDEMGTVIFPKDVYVENLIVRGFVNGINFTKFVEDSVLKTDRDIVITGKKTCGKVVCESLKVSRLNGKSVDSILDPDKHQVLSGSVKVNGTVTVLDRFETDRKIGEVPWQRISERFRYMGNDTYSMNGDVFFTGQDVSIENLIVTDTIQEVNFNDFLESVVYKSSKNITIHGPVIFKSPVIINSSFTITENFNDLSVKYFYEHAVRIDQPLNVKSKIIFTENIVIENDLVVEEELEAKTIGGIDLKELYENTVFVDRPTSITGSVTLENVVFESDIEIETLNDIDLSTVITLEGEQVFYGTLRCQDITVGKLDLGGTVNSLYLNSIYNDTFMLTGNQSISSHIIFDGNVHIRHNFDARLINGVDPKKLISLDGNETLIGNFIFEQPLVVLGNLRTNGSINDIDLLKWEATTVTKSFPIRQIVKGDWIIHGNVYFQKNVHGNDHLDGVNVKKLSDDSHKRVTEIKLMMEDVKKDLHSFCEDLNTLKIAAENQVYKYEFFDYLQVLNFDLTIVSVHQFSFEDSDYLLVNFDSCHLDIFVFTGTEFIRVASLSNVGNIERWFTLRYENEIYFLTVGNYGCDKNTGNLWRLYNDQFIHVEDLGNVSDAKKINDNEFFIIINDTLIRRSIDKIYQKSLSTPDSYPIGNENFKFLVGSSDLLLLNRETILEYKFENGTENRQVKNSFGTSDISSFRLGIYDQEVFVYYDDNISEEYLFISNNNFQNQKILQTIKAQRPSSIVVLNFDGKIENFLIFLENHRVLQIYEYRGIEGFVYRESIRIKADKIFPFKLRKDLRFAKKNCLAVIQGKRLVLMEAKMYGEKLDMGSLSCD